MNYEQILEDIAEDFLDEGAYSNGRYEHPEGKKVSKYHPGHANDVFNKRVYKNHQEGTFRGEAYKFENPMNQRYAGYSYGK